MHQQAIEEKDAALALSNNDLQDHDNQTQVIQYENVGFQIEIKAKDGCFTKTLSESYKRSRQRQHHYTTSATNKYHDFRYCLSRAEARKRYVKLR